MALTATPEFCSLYKDSVMIAFFTFLIGSAVISTFFSENELVLLWLLIFLALTEVMPTPTSVIVSSSAKNTRSYSEPTVKEYIPLLASLKLPG